jgi:hypothetical protein
MCQDPLSSCQLLDLPDPGTRIESARQNLSTVGTECRCPDRFLMSQRQADRLPYFNTPQLSVISAPGEQHFAVGAEDDCPCPSGKAAKV